MTDFIIEKEEMELDDTPSKLPKGKPKKEYVFSQARKDALAKGRLNRMNNLKQKKEDLEKYKEMKKKEDFDILTKNVKDSIQNEEKEIKNIFDSMKESSSDTSSEEVVEKPKPVRKKRVYHQKPKPKKQRIEYITDDGESSEEIIYRPKPRYIDEPKEDNKYAKYFKFKNN